MSAPSDRRDLLDLRVNRPPAALPGVDPVLAAVDAGHYERMRSNDEAKEPARRCRADNEGWPCATIVDARRAGAVRAGRTPVTL